MCPERVLDLRKIQREENTVISQLHLKIPRYNLQKRYINDLTFNIRYFVVKLTHLRSYIGCSKRALFSLSIFLGLSWRPSYISSRPFAFLYFFQAKLGYAICIITATFITLITFTTVKIAMREQTFCARSSRLSQYKFANPTLKLIHQKLKLRSTCSSSETLPYSHSVELSFHEASERCWKYLWSVSWSGSKRNRENVLGLSHRKMPSSLSQQFKRWGGNSFLNDETSLVVLSQVKIR